MSLTDSYPPPRPRPPPPAPLRLDRPGAHSNFAPAAPVASRISSNPFVPPHPAHAHAHRRSSPSRSPPPRSPPPSAVPLLSPTRSAFGGGHTSPTPSFYNNKQPPRQSPMPLQEDVTEFEKHCRDFFYRGSAESGQRIQATLSSLPPSQRARFTRLQASIRAQFHADRTLALQSSLLALLSSITPSGSLTPASRSDPRSKAASKEREEKLAVFVREWAKTSDALVGVRRFLDALCTVLRTMQEPESKGGAGQWRLEWEMDDAMFMESGGEEFMRDSLTLLKGVLGFSDSLPPSPFPLQPPPLHSDPQRSRSSSDPFTDASAPTPPLTHSPTPSHSHLLSPHRLWLSPSHIPNPALSRLLTLFPPEIRRSALPVHFPPAVPDVEGDLERGQPEEGEEWASLQVGRVRVARGRQRRMDGWRGGVLSRLREWFRRVCGV